MTISYNHIIGSTTASSVMKLLLHWRGSIWKETYKEVVCWVIMYAFVSVVYRAILTDNEQKNFEKFVSFCDSRMKYIPLDFMLGFFVTAVVNRWSAIFLNLLPIDNLAAMTSTYVRGNTDRARYLRRTVIRYAVLTQALVFRDISTRVRRRFPTLSAMTAAGFMLPHEQAIYEGIESRFSKYWITVGWTTSLLEQARKEGVIECDKKEDVVVQEVRNFRAALTTLWLYDWVPLPMLYPQLVILAVHSYFFIAVFARQLVVHNAPIDIYFPIMTVLQLIFYFGWLKTALALLNPFGEDDDDYSADFLLDRNLTVGLACADNGHDSAPEPIRDIFWDRQVTPLYSQESVAHGLRIFHGSATLMSFNQQISQILMVEHPEYLSPEEKESKSRAGSALSAMVNGSMSNLTAVGLAVPSAVSGSGSPKPRSASSVIQNKWKSAARRLTSTSSSSARTRAVSFSPEIVVAVQHLHHRQQFAQNPPTIQIDEHRDDEETTTGAAPAPVPRPPIKTVSSGACGHREGEACCCCCACDAIPSSSSSAANQPLLTGKEMTRQQQQHHHPVIHEDADNENNETHDSMAKP